MVDTLVVTAALCTATTLQQAKALHAPSEPPTSLKPSEHVRVQTERRRAARNAANSASSLEALRPMLDRMKADSAVTEAKDLIQQAETQMKVGNQEQAMLTLDGASMRLEALRRTSSGLQYIDVLQDLERREEGLRQQLGAPAIVPFVAPAGKTGDEPAKDDPVVPSTKDELPVG
jgi:hypothetical protein